MDHYHMFITSLTLNIFNNYNTEIDIVDAHVHLCSDVFQNEEHSNYSTHI